MTETVHEWIRRQAHPLNTFDPHDPLTDLEPLRDMVHDATIVGLGASIRHTHELSTTAHRILRFLVEEAGFRALALEGDDEASITLDEYVRTGTGDPRAILAEARSFWRTEEILDVVAWMRSYNQLHPADPLRVANLAERPRKTPLPNNLEGIEQLLADNTIWWHDHTAAKTVYWGGMAHTVNGDPRTISPGPPETHRSAGGHLREHFGAGYASVGLTIHHGSAPYPIPAPPPEFADATLGGAGVAAYLLDLRAPRPEQVREWLEAPAQTRMIGPHYDAENDAAYHLAGGSLADWFDSIVHVREATPVHFLGA